MAQHRQPKVAVVGLGAQGLVTIKNLLEQGFDVTGFDKNDYVGGIWHYVAEHRVSALPTTVVNISRERCSFTDFPFPQGTSSYPTSAEIDNYLNGYCDHFELRPHLRLSTAVTDIYRDEEKNTWFLTVQGNASKEAETLSFEKLVIAVGPHQVPIWPDIEGLSSFKGTVSHSIQYKDPVEFKDKRVMVVGISNTAGDTSTSLVGVASKIYLAHRDGACVVPRYLKDGSSLDHALGFRTGMIKDFLEYYFPHASRNFLDNMMNKIITQEFGEIDPSWRLMPAPSLVHQVPTVSETLIPALRAGNIISTHAPNRIVGDYQVELQDGTIVEVDSIICCTGYHLDYSILGKNDPTLTDTGEHDWKTPKLYQNVFCLQHPNSLAFVGVALTFFPAFLLSDLSSMALAQIWSNKPDTPTLPAQADLEQWYADHLKWVSYIRSLSPRGKFVKCQIQNGPWLEWVQETAGTNVGPNLNYGSLQAWRFWCRNPSFCKLLMDGIWTPHIYRLFDSDRRKTWSGAREAIEKVNLDAKRNKENRKKERLEVAKAVS